MKLHNVRYGFATNSSSSHSIVIGAPLSSDYDIDGDFGWSNFIAASKESKIRWLAAHFNSWGQDSNSVKQDLFNFTDEQLEDYKEDYVDHQSNFYFQNYRVDDSFRNFIAAFTKFVSRDDVQILGGNDNDDYDPNTSNAPVFDKLNRFTDIGSGIRLRVKQEGDYFSIINISNGSKIRLSFEDAPLWSKSDTPELVDLKISDYCPYGCSFCYQGSTKDGKHAPLERLKSIIDALAEAQVFEIAIGGGEPTEHPDFVEILNYIQSKEMIANFTTFSTKWLTDATLVEAVAQTCGGIGVSVHSAKDINKVKKIRDAINQYRYGATVMAQHVVGSASVSDLYEIVNNCVSERIQLLLLGYKTTGFGGSGPTHAIKPEELGTVIQIMKDEVSKNKLWFDTDISPRTYIPVSLSIDTQMIDLYRKTLEQCSIDPTLLASPEGKFSCYWDAVENKVAKSSYCGDDEFYDVNVINSEEFLSIYSRF